MLLTRSLLALLLLPVSAFADEMVSTRFRVLDPDGKPSTTAKGWVFEMSLWKEDQSTPEIKHTAGKAVDPKGIVSFLLKERTSSTVFFFQDDKGRVGGVTWQDASHRLGGDGVEITLQQPIKRKGQVLKADGKPWVGVVVQALSFTQERPRTISYVSTLLYAVVLPDSEYARFRTTTDAEGRFEVLAVAGMQMAYRLGDTKQNEEIWFAPISGEITTQLPDRTNLIVNANGIDGKQLSGKPISIFSEFDLPADKVQLRFKRETKFTEQGVARFEQIPVGKYRSFLFKETGLSKTLESELKPFALLKKAEETITLKFEDAARVTGRVVEADTGKGIAGARVQLMIMKEPDSPREVRRRLYVETDNDGRFTAAGPAGYFRANMMAAPDGYTYPPTQGRLSMPTTKSVAVKIGESQELEPVKLVKAATFTAQVLLDGKPAIGALASTPGAPLTLRNERIPTNEKGEFVFKNLLPDDEVAPRVRLGKAVNVPKVYSVAESADGIKIEISEKNSVTITGTVLDSDGKPVVGHLVGLTHWTSGIGRQAGGGTGSTGASTKTDADGRYRFPGYWVGDGYEVMATNTRRDGLINSVIAKAPGDLIMPDIKIEVTTSAVTGQVLDAEGKPMAGVEVFSVTGVRSSQTFSKADGSFKLEGLASSANFVIARQKPDMIQSIAVKPSENKPVTFTLTKQDPRAVKPIVLPTDYKQNLDKLERHLLQKMWEHRVKLGNGSVAIERMAVLDFDLAKKWRDEEKVRSEGKTNYSFRINEAVREKNGLKYTSEELEDGLAVLGKRNTTDAHYGMMDLGKKLLPLDKAEALRCAEEAVLQARKIESIRKMLALADAADLAIKAGDGLGGLKVLDEAIALAAKTAIKPNSSESMYVGMTAARVAPHDWVKAEKLLNRLSDDDYNRFLSAAITRVAKFDVERAKLLLSKFKGQRSGYPDSGRIRIALAIADKQPGEALALIRTTKIGYSQCNGLLKLATKLSKTDPSKAFAIVEEVFHNIEQKKGDLQHEDLIGDTKGMAIWTLVRAQECGYPNMQYLRDRVLAVLGTRDELDRYIFRTEQKLSAYTILALVDPISARHLFPGERSLESFVQQGYTPSRDWLFAMALSDPALGMQMIDRLYELEIGTSKIDKSKLREIEKSTGLNELQFTLASKDRLKGLTTWLMLMNVLDESDD
jgi:hypothetical protein